MEADMTEIWRYLLGAVWAVTLLFFSGWKRGVEKDLSTFEVKMEQQSRDRNTCQLDTQRHILNLRGELMEGIALINGKLSQIDERLRILDQ